MSYNNAGGNGHNSGITGQGFNPGTFGQGSMNSVTKHLIMPGETAKEMMMKANFKDERVRNAFLRSHQRYTEFHQKKHLETALEYIALSDTINAKGKVRLQEAVIGRFANDLSAKPTKKMQMGKYDKDGVQEE